MQAEEVRHARRMGVDRVAAIASVGIVAVVVAVVVAVLAVTAGEPVSPAPTEVAVAISGHACGRPVHGSGAVVESAVGPVVVTAAHVLAGASQIEVVARDGRARPTTLLGYDEGRDVAVLAAPGFDVGAPLSAHGSGRGSLGVVDATGSLQPRPYEVVRRVTARVTDEGTGFVGSRRALELSAHVDDGDSGAGLFDDGAVVGIVWAASRTDDGRAWAVDASEVEATLADAASDGSVVGGSCATSPAGRVGSGPAGAVTSEDVGG